MATATANSQILKLEVNRPEVLALQYAEGRLCPTKIPGASDQVMFTFTNGTKAFWPVEVAGQIKDAGIGARVPFQITRLSGNRYDIRAMSQPGVHESETEKSWQNVPSHPATSTPVGAQQPIQRSAVTPITPPPPLPGFTAPPAQIQTIGDKLGACYMVAVDTCLATENYAERKGMEIRATFEDVRALAATIFIALNNGGGR